MRGRNDEEFGLTFEARHSDDGFTYQISINPFAGVFDYAGSFITHHARFRRAVGIQTLPREDVGKVQTGGFHANQDFARTWFWIGRLFNAHHFNVTVSSGHDLSHLFLPYGLGTKVEQDYSQTHVFVLPLRVR